MAKPSHLQPAISSVSAYYYHIITWVVAQTSASTAQAPKPCADEEQLLWHLGAGGGGHYFPILLEPHIDGTNVHNIIIATNLIKPTTKLRTIFDIDSTNVRVI